MMSNRSFAEVVYGIVMDDYGGVATIPQILTNKHLRDEKGKSTYDEHDIYQAIYRLRKMYKGKVSQKGTQAWEIIDRRVYALEKLLSQDDRRLINKRHRRNEIGIAESGLKDDMMLSAKISKDGVTKKQLLNKALNVHDESLENMSGTAHLTITAFEEHEEEFGKSEK